MFDAKRVQIPAYTDRWMMGDRYGKVVKVTRMTRGPIKGAQIAHVKLDKSGRVLRFLLDDCTEV